MELNLSNDEGQEMNLRPYDADHLILGVYSGQNARIKLDAADVDKLWAFLNRWLNQGATPPADPEPIYTALIRRLVTEEVARVLPLHQAPQASVPEPDAEDGWRRVDPEPHDVGHADEPADHGRLMSKLQRAAVRVPKCTTCNHFWSDHTGEMCWGHSKCGCAQERP